MFDGYCWGIANISVAAKYLVQTKLSVATQKYFWEENKLKTDTKATMSFSRKTVAIYASLCT